MNCYPDPMLVALQEEDARLTALLDREQAIKVSLLYASLDTRDVFEKRLAEVRRQIALLQGEPA